MFKAPKFWNNKESKVVRILSPFSRVYEIINTLKRNNVTPEKVGIPVICIGNVVLGGAGKTPTVEAVCNILKSNGFKPHVLSCGYGGYLKNVVRVDPEKHLYLQVGDEALLTAKVAPTWTGKNRVNSSKAAMLAGADVLVMDDGFQNYSLRKDFEILVIDSGQGFGNEHVFPAGPLRETVSHGVKKANIVLIIGDKNEAIEDKIREIKKDMRIFYARLKPISIENVDFKRIIGFCGIGYPKKFENTLKECEFDIIDFISFSDHHPYTITEVQRLISKAKSVDAKLVTTMKDFVKIPDVFKNEIFVVNIKLEFEDEQPLVEIICNEITSFKK